MNIPDGGWQLAYFNQQTAWSPEEADTFYYQTEHDNYDCLSDAIADVVEHMTEWSDNPADNRNDHQIFEIGTYSDGGSYDDFEVSRRVIATVKWLNGKAEVVCHG